MKTLLMKTALLAAVIFLPLTGVSDTLRLQDGREITGQYEGGTSRVIRFRSDAGVEEYDLLRVSSVRISGPTPSALDRESVGNSFGELDRPVVSFGNGQERIIRDWFSDRSNLRGLPPGLARRDSLPPGLARQVQRNGTLPPGLQRRVQPLPLDLESRLPQLAEGIERVILGRDVLLMESATAKIVDLLRNVF